jgi:CheY-like chemotaxis protein
MNVGMETITDGKQAVEVASETKPDIILMDIRMPVMDGLEATRILKADAGTRDIPIVALTYHAMKGDKEMIIQAGCDGYLSKPINIKKLKETVAEYLSI